MNLPARTYEFLAHFMHDIARALGYGFSLQV
jgi:hypothetical protein